MQEKYGVVTKKLDEKTASTEAVHQCPVCEKDVSHTHPLRCEDHGTEPFEEKLDI